jgi:hypothetical protein
LKIRREFVKAAIVWALGKKAYKFDVSTLLGVIDFVLNKKGAKDQELIMAFRNFDRR